MEQLAERVSRRLRSEFGDALVGVSHDDEDEIGHVYRSEWAAEKHDPEEIDALVEATQLGVPGYGAHEQRRRERLHATVRIYDELLDVDVPVDDFRGVAVALDTDGDYGIREVVAAVEDVIEMSGAERRPSA